MESNSASLEIAKQSSTSFANRRDDQDCLFLSGVRLHLSCCNPEEQLQLVRIAREGCALRHTDLSPGLTHIVVCHCLHCLHQLQCCCWHQDCMCLFACYIKNS